jgi:hypothetical protein
MGDRLTGVNKAFARQTLRVGALEVDGNSFGDSTMLYSFDSNRGRLVTKDSTIASAPDALFDVTGLCEITLMIGEVTSVIATSTSMSINTSTNDQVISASTQITTDAVGTLYLVTGDPDLGFNSAVAPGIDAAFSKDGQIAPFYMNDDQIEMNVNSAGTGLVKWLLWYKPLESGAQVTAAT